MREYCKWGIEGHEVVAGLATTKDEIDDAYRLRYQEYVVHLKQVDKKYCNDNKEIDKYDAKAIHFVAKLDNKVVGVMRLLPCETDFLLQRCQFGGVNFDTAFNEFLQKKQVDKEYVAEVSRWTAPTVRLNNGKKLLTSLLIGEGMLNFCKESKFKYLLCAMNTVSVNNLRRDGWPLPNVVHGIHKYHGALVEVCYIDVGASYFYRRTV